MIELGYNLLPDGHGIFDGRALARALIADAFALLVPYANACPGCSTELFSTIADEELARAHNDARETGQLRGMMLSVGLPEARRVEAETAHLLAAAEGTERLLERDDGHSGHH